MIGDGGMSAGVIDEGGLNTDPQNIESTGHVQNIMWLDLSDTCHILGQWLGQSVSAYTLTSEPYEPP